jgi:hypothetical protein
MKKTLLLFVAGAMALTTNAQERAFGLINSPEQASVDYIALKKAIKTERGGSGTAQKTTAAPRWYSYVDYFDLYETDLASSIAISAPYLWNDTMAMMAYSGGIWQHNRTVSLGLVTDPAYSGFNNFLFFPGEMKVTSTSGYAVDSIRFFGNYGFNPTKTAVVDTLRVAFVYGNGASTADIYQANTTNPAVLPNYGLTTGDTLKNYRLRYDSVTNTAGGTTRVIRDIILNNSGTSPAWGDTLSTGAYYGRVGLGTAGTGIAIPAGNMIGASISFISGDASFVAHDTVFGSTIGYKYNMFRPYVAYKGTTSVAAFPTYSPTNRNGGMFKTLPDTALGWGGQFIPQWFWTAGGGAAQSQYPYIDFHIVCASCGVVEEEVGVTGIRQITSIEAYPNPTSSELNIPFTLSGKADVEIALANMLGQTVAVTKMQGVSSGKAVMNTAGLPDGLYTLTVTANGNRKTGRIVITH